VSSHSHVLGKNALACLPGCPCTTDKKTCKPPIKNTETGHAESIRKKNEGRRECGRWEQHGRGARRDRDGGLAGSGMGRD